MIATIKVVHAAYYSHVRIRSRAGETPRFPSSSFLSPPPYFLIRGDRLGETDLFLACFFALVLPPFVSSRGLFFLLRRDVYGARRTERAFFLGEGGREREKGGRKIVRQISFREGWWNPLLLEDNFWGGTATGSGF